MSGSTENRAHGASEKPARRETVFNLAEAHRMLPLVQRIVADILDHQRCLSQLTPEQERLHRERRVLNWSERSRLYAMREQLTAADHNLQETLAELGKLGVLIVDSEFGRVGFPTVVNGRRAYFSWQPGEDNIQFWQFPEENNRRPIPVTWLKSANLTLSGKS